MDNTGSFYAVSHLTDYLKSLGHRVRKSSVVDWLVAFEDAGPLFSVNIFSRVALLPPVPGHERTILLVRKRLVNSTLRY